MYAMPYPVALFVYRRQEHTHATLTLLQKNALAKESNLFVFCDGPKHASDHNAVSEVRKTVQNVSGFKNVEIIYRDNNLGLSQSIISGVSEILKTFNGVIIVEDDLNTDPGFLFYMNTALDYYSARPDIFSVSGFVPKIHIPPEFRHDSFLFPIRSHCWGWGTWRRVWQEVDWNMSDYNEFIINKKKK